jgi:hypothetical protein
MCEPQRVNQKCTSAKRYVNDIRRYLVYQAALQSGLSPGGSRRAADIDYSRLFEIIRDIDLLLSRERTFE